ncbi:acyl-CoA N-acyltransferase [Trametes meyenii]|nr:acyl-CoA N-acyltransferase [Trametes meyenii]
MSVYYDLLAPEEVEDAYDIEVRGYPEDEAASLESFRFRQSQAPELFLGAYVPAQDRPRGRTLIGYVCATLSPDAVLTHASMATHIPGARSICIHSVCVDAAQRRRRIGLGLVREYVARAERAGREDGRYARILLIAHDNLRGFYAQAGFADLGRSEVVHGALPWFAMRKDIPGPQSTPASASSSESQHVSASASTTAQAPLTSPASEAPQTSTLPPGLWEALQQQSATRARPAARLLSSFPGSVQDVVSAGGSGGLPANAHDLLCPRPGCGSVILKGGAAGLMERAGVQLDASVSSPGEVLPEWLGALPAPPAKVHWWLVTPNAMAFENIGFSRAVQSIGPGGGKLKYLSCAECDVGPLGWCEEGGSEFWLACNRVGYRV